ncbi:hypothetical protein [Variovorax sp. JS1663]|nr:hypothetical protein [Variovorax sp. JS1663]
MKDLALAAREPPADRQVVRDRPAQRLEAAGLLVDHPGKRQ